MDMCCRSCGNKNLASIFSLGQMPLANRLLTREQLDEAEPTYHLEIVLCESCGLVQLKNIVSPQDLFDDYLYFSSNSETMVQSAKALVEKIIPYLPESSKVIEIASNDGYLLKHYIAKNIQVLGIEPAKNIAQHAISNGIPTRSHYFSAQFARELVKEGHLADIIHANNVMAHVPDLNDFIEGIKILLTDKGQAVIEVPYLLNLVNHCEFDTIYHEHVFYFSLTPLYKLFDRHNLVIADVEQISIHGGSLRLFVKHKKDNCASAEVMHLLSIEKELGVSQLSYYQTFTKNIHQLKDELVKLLISIKDQGKKIAAYGASAKGSTLLNFFGIGHLIDYIVDRSSIKQGYFMSGCRIPIHSPDFLLQENTPFVLLLTWNFAEEILQQQQRYRDQGGKFIIPIPSLQVV